MKQFFILSAFALGLSVASACSSAPETATMNRTANTNTTVANTAAPTNTATTNANHSTKADETPAAVKAVFPDAQSINTQHRDVSDAQIAAIEKDTGSKVPAKDHHSYLAFSGGAGGARKQVGAATIVKVDGRDVVIVYDSKDGSPVIKEIRAEGVPAPFLAQFAGKGHDDDLLLGADIKASGASDAQAKAITEAVRVDVLTMQALYGAAHKH